MNITLLNFFNLKYKKMPLNYYITGSESFVKYLKCTFGICLLIWNISLKNYFLEEKYIFKTQNYKIFRVEISVKIGRYPEYSLKLYE